MKSTRKNPSPAKASEQPEVYGDISETEPPHYVLRLYVTGATPGSRLAIENLRRFCEAEFPGRYELDVIDVYRHPDLARGDAVLAAPTLIKMQPLPVRRLIGNLSNRENMLRGLGLGAVSENGKK